MTKLTEDAPIDVVEQLIAEGEAHRAEQQVLLENQTQGGQDTRETRQSLQAAEEALEALRCRRAYLQAMQTKP